MGQNMHPMLNGRIVRRGRSNGRRRRIRTKFGHISIDFAKFFIMEFVLAGTAASLAGAICNPLEVVKIRMQLQGELKAKGNYKVHYRNVFHAFYTIGTKDGILALQKGVVPFVFYQFAVNSTRLGLFQIVTDRGWTKNSAGKIHSGKTLFFAIACGAVGGLVCSPFYLVKTHLQSKANEISIAVGHQHHHSGMVHALSTIYREFGIRGLWRGTTSNIPRIAAASAGQLSSFEITHEFMKSKFPGQVWLPLFCSSFVAGFFMTTLMAPFDLIATRVFNQGTDHNGKGLFYKNVFDCTAKVYKNEGFLAFFKGWTACYFRLGPYTMLIMVIWDRLKFQYNQFSESRLKKHM